MLIGLPACLGPELLAGLRAMGHGDEIALVDGNYPAATYRAPGASLVRCDGLGVLEILDAVLQVLPLDDVEAPILHATAFGDGNTLEPVHHRMREICARRAPGRKVAPAAGSELYARVRRAQIIVATGEPRLYANIVLRKGVIRPA